MNNSCPFLSIVTVCYNSEKTLARTLASVDSQTYKNYEHIIIDGKSTDQTIEIIQSKPSDHRRWISERDAGIFDAMNKGIRISNGEYICFLNSDDTFYSDLDLEHVAKACELRPEILYGKTQIIDEGNAPFEIGKKIAKDDYYFGTPIIHQAVFVRRDIFNRYGGFDLSVIGGAADWVWLAKYFLSNHGPAEFLDKTIIRFYRGGASNRFVWENYLARIRLSKELHPWWVFLCYLSFYPLYFVKFRIFRLHEDTKFRRFIRRCKSSIRKAFGLNGVSANN